jgi:hypothetical protein
MSKYKVVLTEEAAEGVAVYNPQWDRYIDLEKEFHEFMSQAGYGVWHTGGGCMAWHKPLDKDRYLMITVDASLGFWASRDVKEWSVGLYDESDALVSSRWVGWKEEVTLDEALRIGTEILPHLQWE